MNNPIRTCALVGKFQDTSVSDCVRSLIPALLERHLTVLEEKLFAALLATTPDADLLAVRAEADRDLAPYRRKMSGPQIEQLQKQYVQKRLLEKYALPRLSLFYM